MSGRIAMFVLSAAMVASQARPGVCQNVHAAPTSQPTPAEIAALRARVADLDTELAVYQLRELGVHASLDRLTFPGKPPRISVDLEPVYPISKMGAQLGGPFLYESLPLVRRLVAGDVNLQCAASQVDDAYLRALAHMPSIVAVNLQATAISDAGVESVATLANLTFLNLRLTPITDRGVKALAACKHLRHLSLQAGGEPLAPNVTDAGITALSGLTDLEELNLACTGITDAGLRQLRGLTKLRTLELDDTAVTAEGLRSLSKMSQLECLTLWRAQGVSDTSVDVLIQLPKLHRLNLIYTHVTDAGAVRLKGALPGLQVQWTHDANRSPGD